MRRARRRAEPGRRELIQGGDESRRNSLFWLQMFLVVWIRMCRRGGRRVCVCVWGGHIYSDSLTNPPECVYAEQEVGSCDRKRENVKRSITSESLQEHVRRRTLFPAKTTMHMRTDPPHPPTHSLSGTILCVSYRPFHQSPICPSPTALQMNPGQEVGQRTC